MLTVIIFHIKFFIVVLSVAALPVQYSSFCIILVNVSEYIKKLDNQTFNLYRHLAFF